jgi:hypothetical protein
MQQNDLPLDEGLAGLEMLNKAKGFIVLGTNWCGTMILICK